MQAFKVAILFALIASTLAASGSVKILNSGWYVTYFTVSYSLNGQQQTETTPNYTAGMAKSISIPDGATGIQVTSYAYVFIGSDSTIFSKTLDAPADKCYSVGGTTLSTSYEEQTC